MAALTEADIDRVLLAVCEVHDGGELWAHTRRDPEAFRNAVRQALAKPKPAKCPRQVFVDDGFPPGQCQRRAGHDGLCDVYDGRDEDARKAKPWTPDMGVIDFNGERVP